MALRTGHGNGAGAPRIEVLPADELPEGVQGEALAPHRPERDGKGRFRPGARTAQSAGGAPARDLTRLARRLTLGSTLADPRFEPFAKAAAPFRKQHVTTLARNVGGGFCGTGPSSMVASYSLTEDMVIGGDPFVAWVFDLKRTFNGGTIFGSTVWFGDSVTFNGPLVAEAGASFSGGSHFLDSAEFHGPADFSDNVTVFGIASLQGGVNLSGAVNVYGPTSFAAAASASFAGTVELLGATTVPAPIGFADSGKVKWRNQTIAAAGNQSIVAAQVDTVLIPDGVMASGNSLTISDTGAANGMRVRFKSEDNANVVCVREPGGTALNGGLVGGVNTTTWIDVERIGGVWKLTGAGRDSYT